ncbi:MAG: hypothetical protein V1867_03770 [Candidatus Falkowbacteria bacterium]
MPNKEDLIRLAEESFPAHYRSMRRRNPDMKLPQKKRKKNFPKVLEMEVRTVSKEWEEGGEKINGSYKEIIFTVRINRGIYKVKGFCYDDDVDADCFFYSEAPEGARKFAKLFAAHLIYNVMSEQNLSIDDWEYLPRSADSD